MKVVKVAYSVLVGSAGGSGCVGECCSPSY